MFRRLYAIEPALADYGRFPALARPEQTIHLAEIVLLVSLGVCAAALTQWWDMNLGVPGHAILRVVFPISLGMALVPRRGAGATVGMVGMGTSLAIQGLRLGSAGEGAMTSLALTGLLLDGVASQVRRGWQLYAGLIGAGLVANMVAFGVKAYVKLSTTAVVAAGSGGGMGGGTGGGMGGGMGRGMGGGGGLRRGAAEAIASSGGGGWETWWPRAIVSYPLCGILAGLICALLLFRMRRSKEQP